MTLSSFSTLHITGYPQEIEVNSTITSPSPSEALIKELYNKALKQDESFHFFYEPALIIRLSSVQVKEKIAKWLKKRNYTFVIYDYPTPAKEPNQYRYGEAPEGIVLKYLNLFLSIFHAHSIAALEMTCEEHDFYKQQVIEDLLDRGNYSPSERFERLRFLGISKLENQSIKLVDLKNRANFKPHFTLAQKLLKTLSNTHAVALQRLKRSEFFLEDEYFHYTERVIHSLFNQANYSRHEEGTYLFNLADLEKEERFCIIF